jgi:hypothetical protein
MRGGKSQKEVTLIISDLIVPFKTRQKKRRVSKSKILLDSRTPADRSQDPSATIPSPCGHLPASVRICERVRAFACNVNRCTTATASAGSPPTVSISEHGSDFLQPLEREGLPVRIPRSPFPCVTLVLDWFPSCPHTPRCIRSPQYLSERKGGWIVPDLRQELTEFLLAVDDLIASHVKEQLSPDERSMVDACLRDLPVLLMAGKETA